MTSIEGAGGAARPLDILIVGGSIAGLIAGIKLKRNGHNVRILEKATSSEREGMAAGIGLSLKIKEFFEDEDDLKDIPLGVLNDEVFLLNKDLVAWRKFKVGFNMTTWDAAYYRLRANFDGIVSGYCLKPPPVRGTGKGMYQTGKAVTHVAEEGDCIVAFVHDTTSGMAERQEGDIIIAADGGASAIRSQVFPDTVRDTPGYVLWRGTVPTSDISQGLLDKIEGNANAHMAKYSYVVIYTIPGKDGSLKAGERHINFAWYFWPTKPTLEEIMTDTNGHRHRTTVPKGKLRPEIWDATVRQARSMLPQGLMELVEKIPQPFVSVISSIGTPKAAFFNRKLFLIGDALTQSQPNLGQGTNLAATAAIGLVDAIGPAAHEVDAKKLDLWEQDIISQLDMMRLRSKAMASWYLESWWGFLRDVGLAIGSALRHRAFGTVFWSVSDTAQTGKSVRAQ